MSSSDHGGILESADARVSGRIHSIETLGAADGPGLRTVIFLQGCPLACRYCHNPDSWSPNGGKQATVAELVRRSIRSKPYFGDQGGVTLSGGEPLRQPTFTAALLSELKRAGIKTALDTSGWMTDDGALLPEILRNADLVILDVKSPDPDRFAWLTGRPQGPLAAFMDACCRAGASVWIRQVIVPGWNDHPSDIGELAAFLARWPDLRVDRIQLLPYHSLGEAKWRCLGRAYPFAGLPPLAPDRLAELQQRIDQLFIRHIE